ncbi:MAG: hypothetical protein PHH77_06285 [Victivallaceae bacterium]|nr:hypothetical protein [Victivallaceae bacterium]
MGKKVMKNSPVGNRETATSSPDEFAARIEQLEKLLIHTRQKRVRQSVVVWSCTVILIAVCAWFLVSFHRLIRNYDTKLLTQELQGNAGIIIQSPQFEAVILDMKKIFLPAFEKALKSELSADTPKLQAEAEAELRTIREFILTNIQQDFINQIRRDLVKIEQDLLKRYPDLNAAQLEDAYKKASELFADKLTASLNRSVTLAVNKLAGLDETFRQFKNDRRYQELSRKSVPEVETLLLESALELWIYDLNPAKGQEPIRPEIKKPAKRNK